MPSGTPTPADDLRSVAEEMLFDFEGYEAARDRENVHRIRDHVRSGIGSILAGDPDFKADLRLKSLTERDPATRAETLKPLKLKEFLKSIHSDADFISTDTQLKLYSLLSSVPAAGAVASPAAPTVPSAPAPIIGPAIVSSTAPLPTTSSSSVTSAVAATPSPTTNPEKKKKTWAERYYGKDIPISNGVVDSINNVFEAGWLGRINIFSPNFVLRQFLKNDEK